MPIKFKSPRDTQIEMAIFRWCLRPEDFESRRAALEREGKPSGSLLQKYEGPMPFSFSQMDYEKFSLVVSDGAIFVVEEPLRRSWMDRGGPDWCLPNADTANTQDKYGLVQSFGLTRRGPGGSFSAVGVSSDNTGSHFVLGNFADRFIALGGIPVIGYPVMSTSAAGDSLGYITKFRRAYEDDAQSALVMHGDNKVYHVHGDIYRLWTSIGQVSGALSYPRSDEFGEAEQRSQYFLGGTVRWTPSSQSFIEVEDFHIRFRGVRAIRSYDEFSPNAEYYFGVGATPRVQTLGGSRVTKLPVAQAEYDTMRAGRIRHDNVVVYTGKSDGVALIVSGAERDTGDPDKYRALLEEGTKKATSALVSALGALLGGPVGGAVGSASTPLTDAVGKSLADEINSLLDTGDNYLSTQVVFLDFSSIKMWRELVPAYVFVPDGDPIPHHFSVDLGDGKNWVQLYFEVCNGAG